MLNKCIYWKVIRKIINNIYKVIISFFWYFDLNVIVLGKQVYKYIFSFIIKIRFKN